jgi:hypothetical protein
LHQTTEREGAVSAICVLAEAVERRENALGRHLEDCAAAVRLVIPAAPGNASQPGHPVKVAIATQYERGRWGRTVSAMESVQCGQLSFRRNLENSAAAAVAGQIGAPKRRSIKTPVRSLNQPR